MLLPSPIRNSHFSQLLLLPTVCAHEPIIDQDTEVESKVVGLRKKGSSKIFI